MKAKGIGTPAVVAVIVIVTIAGIGGYFVLKGGEANSELKNKFLQDAKELANLAINVGAGGGGAKEIQVPDNARLKFENQSVIAMIGGEEHSYDIYSDVIGTTLETGEYVLVLSFNEDEDRVEIVLQGGEEGVPAPAEFEVSNLTFYPSEVEVGESVTISTTVKNTGELEGTYTVELKIDGIMEKTEDVTLAGGENRTVSFTIIKTKAKIYEVDVGGLKSTFNVTIFSSLSDNTSDVKWDGATVNASWIDITKVELLSVGENLVAKMEVNGIIPKTTYSASEEAVYTIEIRCGPYIYNLQLLVNGPYRYMKYVDVFRGNVYEDRYVKEDGSVDSIFWLNFPGTWTQTSSAIEIRIPMSKFNGPIPWYWGAWAQSYAIGGVYGRDFLPDDFDSLFDIGWVLLGGT